jgi:IS1 family transposase
MRCGVLYNQNSKARWLWQAVDRATREVLAYVLEIRENRAFLQLKGKDSDHT